MTIIADDKRRVTLPPPARPGTAYSVETDGDRIVLTRLAPPPPARPRLVRRRGLKLIAGVPVSARQIAADLNRARDERAQDLP